MEFLHCSIHRANLHWCEIEHKNQVKKDIKISTAVISWSKDERKRNREIERDTPDAARIEKALPEREGIAGVEKVLAEERTHRWKEGLPLFNKICKFSYQKKKKIWVKLIGLRKKKKKN